MSNIPHARAVVAAVRSEIAGLAPDAAARLDAALEHMKRRPSTKPRAPRRSKRIDPATAAAIRAFAVARPDLSHQDLADKFQVNSGRVSESLAGDR